MGSTPYLLYTILCVVFEARVINLCDRNIATHTKKKHNNNVRKTNQSTFIYKNIQTNGFIFTRKIIKLSFQTMSIYLINIGIL